MPPITITNGNPTTLMPLSFVTIVSMIKDALEDYKWSINDRWENQNSVLIANKKTDVFE